MADNDQAQADLSDSTPGDDLATQGASHDPEITGATNLADYQAMVDDLGDDEQGDEPAESEESPVEEDDAGNGEEEEIPAGEEEAVEEEPEPKSSNRFRFNSPEDQAVAAIAKAKGVSLVEAARIFAAESAPASQEAEAEAEETAPARTLADVEAEYAATRAERKAAMAGLEIEKAGDLDDKLEDLRDEREALRLAEATAGATRESAEEARFFTEYEQAEAKAVAHYPDTTNAESALTKRMVELDQTMKRLGDPLFHSPNKPFLLAQKAAIELGIPMADPKAARNAPASPATKRRTVPPASGSARTTEPVETATKLEKAIGQTATMDDYENLVAGFGVGGL